MRHREQALGLAALQPGDAKPERHARRRSRPRAPDTRCELAKPRPLGARSMSRSTPVTAGADRPASRAARRHAAEGAAHARRAAPAVGSPGACRRTRGPCRTQRPSAVSSRVTKALPLLLICCWQRIARRPANADDGNPRTHRRRRGDTPAPRESRAHGTQPSIDGLPTAISEATKSSCLQEAARTDLEPRRLLDVRRGRRVASS